MHHTYQNYTLEVVQEAIFLRITEFQQHQQIQLINPHTLQHHENCYIVSIGGRSGGIFHNSKSWEPTIATLE